MNDAASDVELRQGFRSLVILQCAGDEVDDVVGKTQAILEKQLERCHPDV